MVEPARLRAGRVPSGAPLGGNLSTSQRHYGDECRSVTIGPGEEPGDESHEQVVVSVRPRVSRTAVDFNAAWNTLLSVARK